MKRRATAGHAKPFLKWVGGKARLATRILAVARLDDPDITEYVEPFLGAGAVMYHVLNDYEPSKVVAADINGDLIDTYNVVRNSVEPLIAILNGMDDEHAAADQETRKQVYYQRRDEFNALVENGNDLVRKAALMIYLNHTCFNGLYRVNAKGKFNVPFDIHRKKVTICDAVNLRECAKALQNVRLRCADYRQVLKSAATPSAWVYLDPPYRALRETSFTAYTDGKFNNVEQDQLVNAVHELTKRGVRVTMNNSDPTNVDTGDRYFDNAFLPSDGYTLVEMASRHVVGRNGASRAPLRELMITNF